MKNLSGRLSRVLKKINETHHSRFNYIKLLPDETKEQAAERLGIDLKVPGTWLFCDYGKPYLGD